MTSLRETITLATIVEICAWLSITVFVNGYVWVQTVGLMFDLPISRYFGVSDYIAYGAESSILIVALALAIFIVPITPKNVVSPVLVVTGKLVLKRLAMGFGAALGLVGVGTIYLYLRAPEPFGPAEIWFVGAIIFATTITFFTHDLYRGRFPFRVGILPIAILAAILLWTASILAAVAQASTLVENTDLRRPIYKFADGRPDLKSAILLLGSDRYLMFIEPISKDIRVIKRDDLIEVEYPSSKGGSIAP